MPIFQEHVLKAPGIAVLDWHTCALKPASAIGRYNPLNAVRANLDISVDAREELAITFMLNYLYVLLWISHKNPDLGILAMELLSNREGYLVMMTKPDISILVVEDEKLLNWSLAKLLSKWGFHVLPVFTGSDAMAQMEKGGFDVILLDYQLPDLDGLQVARWIRKTQPKAFIILVTAFQLSELAVDAGLIDAYYNKPLDFQQLHQALLSLPGWSQPAGGVRESQPQLS